MTDFTEESKGKTILVEGHQPSDRGHQPLQKGHTVVNSTNLGSKPPTSGSGLSHNTNNNSSGNTGESGSSESSSSGKSSESN